MTGIEIENGESMVWIPRFFIRYNNNRTFLYPVSVCVEGKLFAKVCNALLTLL